MNYCIEEQSIEVQNSRRPLDHLTPTLTLTFDLIFIDGKGIVVDYSCANCLAILVSAVLVISCGQTGTQTDRQTESQRRINAILTRQDCLIL